MWSCNHSSGHISGENINSKRYTYSNAHSSIIYNIQDMEATYKSINRWGNKQNVWDIYKFSSVHLSCSVMSDSLPPQGLQQARLLCSSQTPRAYSNSCPLSWWCHPTISSSVVPFSSWLQSFPASGSFPMSQFFTSGGQIWLPYGLRVKNPPAKQKTWVQSLGQKEPLEEGMAIHSSILA